MSVTDKSWNRLKSRIWMLCSFILDPLRLSCADVALKFSLLTTQVFHSDACGTTGKQLLEIQVDTGNGPAGLLRERSADVIRAINRVLGGP